MGTKPGLALMQPEPLSEPPKCDTIEELFAALESPLLGYAFRLVGDQALAEDMVQEAFMKLHAQFDQVLEPRRWLYRTVHNQAMNSFRRSGKIVAFPTGTDEGGSPVDHAADPQPLPDEQMARGEGIDLVRLGLETLDDRARELIRLKFNEDLSYKEISARTGLTVGHVGYILHHALKSIAGELERMGVRP